MALCQGVAQVKFVLPGGVCFQCWQGALPDFPHEIPALQHQCFVQHREGTVTAGAKSAASVVVCPGRMQAVALRALWVQPGQREGWERGDAELCTVLHCASPLAPWLEHSPWISFQKALMQSKLRVITWMPALSIGVNSPSQQHSETAHCVIL